MRKSIILAMFCLLILNNVKAAKTTYILEPIRFENNHFEEDPGKRHAPPKPIILSVEQEEDVFTIQASPAYNIKNYFTDCRNEILYVSENTPTNGELQIAVPSNIAEATTNIILEVNNKTYIGYKQ